MKQPRWQLLWGLQLKSFHSIVVLSIVLAAMVLFEINAGHKHFAFFGLFLVVLFSRALSFDTASYLAVRPFSRNQMLSGWLYVTASHAVLAGLGSCALFAGPALMFEQAAVSTLLAMMAWVLICMPLACMYARIACTQTLIRPMRLPARFIMWCVHACSWLSWEWCHAWLTSHGPPMAIYMAIPVVIGIAVPLWRWNRLDMRTASTLIAYRHRAS